MAQQTMSEIRQAIATYLAAAIPSLSTVTTRLGEINPPCAIILPAQGTFATYQVTFDGQVNLTLRALVLVSSADSSTGQDQLDPYLDITGPNSIWAALRADPTCGGGVDGFAIATEATGYGLQDVGGGLEYLGASVIIEIGD